MNIALFGGSFDPPHLGHEEIVLKAIDTLDIEKIIVVPTYLSPFKNKSHLSANDRFELVKELFKENKKVLVSNYELKQECKVPTIQTVKYLKKEGYDCIYLIIGADNLESLHLWNNYEELKGLVNIVVATRDNRCVDGFETLDIKINVSSTTIRENLNKSNCLKPMCDITLIPNKIQEKVKELWKKELKE